MKPDKENNIIEFALIAGLIIVIIVGLVTLFKSHDDFNDTIAIVPQSQSR